jgi:hypothetical protein
MQRFEQKQIEFLHDYLLGEGLDFSSESECKDDIGNRYRADIIFPNFNKEICVFEFKSSNIKIDLINLFRFKYSVLHKDVEIDRYYVITPRFCFDFSELKGRNEEEITKLQNKFNSNPQSKYLDKYKIDDLLVTVSSKKHKLDLKKYFNYSYFDNIYKEIQEIGSKYDGPWGEKKAQLLILFYIVKQYKEPTSFKQASENVIPKDEGLLRLYYYMTKKLYGTNMFESKGFEYIVEFLNKGVMKVDDHSFVITQQFINDKVSDFFDFFIYKKFCNNRSYGLFDSFPPILDKFIASIYNVKKGDSVLSISNLSEFNNVGIYLPDISSYEEYQGQYESRVISELRYIAYSSTIKNLNIDLKTTLINQGNNKRYDIIFFDTFLQDNDISMQALLDRLSEKGKLLILTSLSFLFSSKREDSALRRSMIDKNLLDIVIQLPPHSANLSSSPMCLVGVDKEKKNEQVTFVDIHKLTISSFSDSNELNPTSKNYLDIISDIKQRNNLVKGVKTVSNSEIIDMNYDLSVNQFVVENPDGFEEAVTFQELFKEPISSLQVGLRSNYIDKKIGYFIKIKDLVEEGEVDKSLKMPLIREKLIKGCQIIKKDALLVSLRFKSLKPTIFRFNKEPIYIDNRIAAFDIFKYSNEELIYFISEMNSSFVRVQLEKYSRGSTMPGIRKSDLMKIRLRVSDHDALFSEDAAIDIKYDDRGIKKAQNKLSNILKEDAKERDKYQVVIQNQKKELQKLEMELAWRKIFFEDLKDFIHDVKTPIAGVGITFIENKIDEKYLNEIKDYLNDIDEKSRGEKPSLQIFNIYDVLLERFEKKTEVKSNNPNYSNYKVNYKKMPQKQVVEFLLIISKNRGIDTLYDELEIEVNKNDFKRSIDNIIQNTIEHGFIPSKEKINKVEVLIEPDSKDADFIIVQIMNNGVQIENREQILRGKRYTATGDKKRGRGIKSIQRFVSLYGGKFDIDTGSDIHKKYESLISQGKHGLKADVNNLIEPFVFIHEREDEEFHVSYNLRLPIKK